MLKLYECHITVNKTKSEKLFKDLAKEYKWKTSAIDGDPVLGNNVYFYFTTYDDDFDRMRGRMENFVDVLQGTGTKVVRKKIEKIVYDERC